MNRIGEIDRAGGVLPVIRHDPNGNPNQQRSPGEREEDSLKPRTRPANKPSSTPGFGGIVDTFATGPTD